MRTGVRVVQLFSPGAGRGEGSRALWLALASSDTERARFPLARSQMWLAAMPSFPCPSSPLTWATLRNHNSAGNFSPMIIAFVSFRHTLTSNLTSRTHLVHVYFPINYPAHTKRLVSHGKRFWSETSGNLLSLAFYQEVQGRPYRRAQTAKPKGQNHARKEEGDLQRKRFTQTEEAGCSFLFLPDSISFL